MRHPVSLAAYLTLARRKPQTALTFPEDRPPGEAVWIHAGLPDRLHVLINLAERLLAHRPGVHVVITAAELPDDIDLPGSFVFQKITEDSFRNAMAFLTHWRPGLLLWSGGHLMPAYLIACREMDVTMVLMDASESGFQSSRFAIQRSLVSVILKYFPYIFAESGNAAKVLLGLGVPNSALSVTGPMREGAQPPACRHSDLEDLMSALAGRPVWLAAGVAPDEVDLIAQTHRQVARFTPRILLILMPDRESHAAQIARAIETHGFRQMQWSTGDLPGENTQVLLVDELSDPGLWYRVAPVTLLGSSLTPSGRGMSPHAPAALGSAIVHGPHVADHLDAYTRLDDAGGARLVRVPSSLPGTLTHLLSADKAAAMANAAWQVVTEGAEVTDRIIDIIQDTLDQAGVSA